MLDISTLEGWLWEAACKIRGEVDAAKYKDFILPMIFLKRLSDVYDDEIDKLAEEYGDQKTAEAFVKEDHSLVWFYLPQKARWESIAKLTSGVGEQLTDAVRAIAKENEKLQGVVDVIDFNATAAGQRVISDDKLKLLIDTLNRHRLGLKDVEPDIIGRAYEYLLRKFAEGSGQSAGEFYTPREAAILMSYILNPEEGEEKLKGKAGNYTPRPSIDALDLDALEKSTEEFLKLAKAKLGSERFSEYKLPENELLNRIKNGETKKLEFKATLRWNIRGGNIDKEIENTVLKAIAAFCNTEGGELLIGVADNGDILGLEMDKFKNEDKFLLHLRNLIRQRLKPTIFQFVDYEIIELRNKRICKVNCKASTKAVWFKPKEDKEEFYVREGPSSSPLLPSAAADYIKEHFE